MTNVIYDCIYIKLNIYLYKRVGSLETNDYTHMHRMTDALCPSVLGEGSLPLLYYNYAKENTMRKLIEKSIIAIFSLYTSYNLFPNIDFVYYLLISIVISIILDLLTNKNLRLTIYFAFIILGFYDNMFLFYLPLIFYNMYIDLRFYSLFFLLLILVNSSPLILILSIISCYFSYTTDRIDNVVYEYRYVRDSLKEDALYLKKYNEQLQIDREKNIQIAILTERNRIAREIHDSIGHAISSSILQVKALKVISNKSLDEPLDLLQDTLNNGMTDIRKSLQGIRDESLDLKARIESLIDEIPNLNVELLYNLEANLEYHLKFDILSIIKEAITNTIKHSNATIMKINLIDQPKFYSIIISDNGNNVPSLENRGIGLDYIHETANKYNGLFNYKFEDGFKIHLTLMKGD